jgi:MinD superfamily P-loop ATPase
MKQMVVLSGKGGTGKTTVTSSLAQLLKPIVIADCDVEAPNLHLLLSPQRTESSMLKVSRKARIDPELCDACGLCAQHCRFDAIPPSEPYVVDTFRCEGCGVCGYVCPRDAIEFFEIDGAELYKGTTPYGPMVGAELEVGEEASGKVVSNVRTEAEQIGKDTGLALIVIDGSPGTGCPVIASMTGADLVLIVTEPSLSGLHDLERILEVAEHFGIQTLVCINKCDIVPELADRIREKCRDVGIEVVAEIPFSREIVEALRNGQPPIGKVPQEVEQPFLRLAEVVRKYTG